MSNTCELGRQRGKQRDKCRKRKSIHLVPDSRPLPTRRGKENFLRRQLLFPSLPPPPHNKSCRRPSVSRNDNHLSAFPSLSLPPSLFLSTRRARLAKKASLWRERERESVRTSVGKSIPAGAFPGDRKKERGKNGNLQSTFALGCLVILIFPPQLYILGSSSLY